MDEKEILEGSIPAIVIGWRDLASLLHPILSQLHNIQACSLRTPHEYFKEHSLNSIRYCYYS